MTVRENTPIFTVLARYLSPNTKRINNPMIQNTVCSKMLHIYFTVEHMDIKQQATQSVTYRYMTVRPVLRTRLLLGNFSCLM